VAIGVTFPAQQLERLCPQTLDGFGWLPEARAHLCRHSGGIPIGYMLTL